MPSQRGRRVSADRGHARRDFAHTTSTRAHAPSRLLPHACSPPPLPPPPPGKPLASCLLARNATGDSAVVCYIRLIQRMGPDGPETMRSNETRVFEKAAGQWVCVHFHKTPV